MSFFSKSSTTATTTTTSNSSSNNTSLIRSDEQKYAVGFAIGALAVAGIRLGVKYLWPLIKGGKSGGVPKFIEEQLLRHVYVRAAQNDADSVLAVIDDFCWKNQFMMNIGDRKGKVLQKEVLNKKPKVVIELGGYCGYSAVLIGKSLPVDGHLYSIEIDPLYAAIATKIIEFAGLKDKVTVVVGTISTRWQYLQSHFKVQTVDLIFLDHVKTAYLPDFKFIENVTGFIKSGTVIVADNVIYPGAPDYLEYVRSNPSYKNTFYEAMLEYSETQKDGIEVSVRI